jgi:hypothetical protein
MTNKAKRKTAAAILKESGEEAYDLRRIQKSEKQLADQLGFGATPKADALYRKYCEKLEELIRADKANSRRLRDVWGALGKLEVKDIAERLFKLGLTAAVASSIGRDSKGVKNARDVTLWLGDRLSQHQKKDPVLDLRIGAWGATFLLPLDPFILDDDKVLTLSRSKSIESLFRSVDEKAAYNNPYLLPPTDRLAPWTGVRQGPLGSRIPLVNRRYSEPVVQLAIDSGQMSRLLSIMNYLQDVWFVINEPILNIAKQLPPEIPLPPLKDGLDPAEAKKQRRRFNRAPRKAKDYHEDLELAELVACGGQFNVPHNMDFRRSIRHSTYQLPTC